ncbi:MAG TPA: hypothetical protein VEJ36_06710 [Nitrososphaerales archaeon]|nr:hypothetical protein [Nitrososphaerales archaeon]
MRAEIYEGSEKLGEVTLGEKTFSTGSRGYYSSAKLEVHGKRYQVNFQLVEIGSKPAK